MRSGCSPAEPYPHGCNGSFAYELYVYTGLRVRQKSLVVARLQKEYKAY